MKRFSLITAITIFSVATTIAQDKKWTLGDCIDYALMNNINLQRQRLQTETAEVNLFKSRMDVLPTLNMGSDGRIGFGRSVNPVSNDITFKQNISHSYYLSTGITLFNGFATWNNMAANKFMLKAGIETEKIQRNTLVLNIMTEYYRVIYTKGLENASRMQMELSEKQLFRIGKMVETGKEALSRQYEIESQASSDRLNYTLAMNTASQALTSLRQVLQLEPGQAFDVAEPELAGVFLDNVRFSTDSVFAIASEKLPRLRAIEYELAGLKKQVAAAKGYIAPGITAGGQLFTGYYKVIGEGTVAQSSYTTQLKNNNSQSVFLSLDIPLFNRYSTGRNIKLAKIRMSDAELRLELERNTLYTEVENACLDYMRTKDEFIAAQANHQFNIKSFDAVEKRFESGLVDVTDYSAAKTKLFRAETETLRTKLQLAIYKLTLKFYTTGEYEELNF